MIHLSKYFYWIFSAFLLLNCNKKNENNKALLGQYLFFDTNLSINNSKSCSSCHNPNFAFTDGYRQSITALGESTLHNAPSLINVGELKVFDWANPTLHSLEKQMLRPLFGTSPIELGTDKKLEEIRQYFKNNLPYKNLIEIEFGNIDTIKIERVITKSIATYLLQLNSKSSKFDNYLVNKASLTVSEKNGMKLFFSKKIGCSNCHALPNFTLADKSIKNVFFNTGLYNVKNENLYPEYDKGLALFTGNIVDNGKFKIPSLRNIMLTSPYMHDGSVASLGEVIDIYAAGGRNMTTGIYVGDGRKNKYKQITGFDINAQEKKDLLSFLQTLTDSTIFLNPKFKNPFPNQ